MLVLGCGCRAVGPQLADEFGQFLDRQFGGGGVHRFFAGVLVVGRAVKQRHEVADVADRPERGCSVDGLVGTAGGLWCFGEAGHEFGDVVHGAFDSGGPDGLAGSLVALGGLLQEPDEGEDLVERPGGRGGVHESVNGVGADGAVRPVTGLVHWFAVGGFPLALVLGRFGGLGVRCRIGVGLNPGVEGLDSFRGMVRPYRPGLVVFGRMYRGGSGFARSRHDDLPVRVSSHRQARGGHMHPEPS
ncbi:hypothetical protein [Streptomyces californicus]|uniref:hypothetical protein n=1 Tax=Streptomyces californicus TaxID=67351 RepID=UPI0037021641